MYELHNYQTSTGRVPFESWIESLHDTRTADAMVARLARIRAGNLGDTRRLGAGVYELRFFFGPGYRIYFARPSRFTLLLLTCGAKASQRADIEKAKAWYADYQARQVQP
jgi:putative addiction module killer protein